MAKRALCVGINDYQGVGSDLSGCVNDAKDWKAVLEARGYQVRSLIDKEATKVAMLAALNELVHSGASGDSLAFTYSGHGSWLPDRDGDELDGRDELLCPWDIADNQYIVDDDLQLAFSEKKPGVRMTFVSDSCHSGSVARFAPPLFPDEAKTHPRPRLLPPTKFVRDVKELKAIDVVAGTAKGTRKGYPVLLLAGCQDTQLSWDTSFGGRPNGAFTRVAIDALKKNPGTPRKWMALIREALPTATLPQTPRLFGLNVEKDGVIF